MAQTSEQSEAELRRRLDAISADIGKLASVIKELGEDAAAQAKRRATMKAEELAGRAHELGDAATAEAKRELEMVQGFIREKPVQSAIIAFLIGLALGGLGRR